MTGAFAAFGLALVGVVALTPVAMAVARANGVLDRPDRRLKRHRKPVPYLGGVAICAACVGAVLAVKMAVDGTPKGVVGMLAGGTAVFLLGLWDDLRPLTPRVKLAFQVATAAIPVALGVHIKFIANPWVAYPLTILWIVGVTNAFNLLDIMDGLCAGLAAVAAAVFWIISLQNGRWNDAVAAAALTGCAAGFLLYNRPPAKVFMGDAGSLFLGFMLASVALGEGYSMNTNVAVVAPLLILGVPIFETFFVMAVRWQQGKPMLQGSPDHVPLRLLRLGYARRGVLAALWTAGAVLGGAGFLVVHANWERVILVSFGVAVTAMLVAIKLASVDMRAR